MKYGQRLEHVCSQGKWRQSWAKNWASVSLEKVKLNNRTKKALVSKCRAKHSKQVFSSFFNPSQRQQIVRDNSYIFTVDWALQPIRGYFWKASQLCYLSMCIFTAERWVQLLPQWLHLFSIAMHCGGPMLLMEGLLWAAFRFDNQLYWLVALLVMLLPLHVQWCRCLPPCTKVVNR